MAIGSKLRAKPVWFWIVVAVLIVVLVGIYFLFGWITPGLFAWVSSFSIVQPLTIALVVVAVVLGGVFIWQHRTPRAT